MSSGLLLQILQQEMKVMAGGLNPKPERSRRQRTAGVQSEQWSGVVVVIQSDRDRGRRGEHNGDESRPKRLQSQ